MKRHTSRLVAWFLSCALILSMLSGCQVVEESEPQREELSSHAYALLDEAMTPVGQAYWEEFPVPVEWRLEGETNTTVYCMHSFRFLDDLYLKYIREGEEQAKETIIQYMCDYLDYGDKQTQDVYYAWSDDSVARRVYRFAYWTHLFQDDFPDGYLERMKEELAYQADLLTDPDFYNWNHNHGMFQDMGLIAYAIFWADEQTRGEYLQLAKERSEGYFDYVFTEEGVHKEHSPRYGYNIGYYLLLYAELYREEDPQFSEKCSRIYEGCGDFFAQITMPNGRIPSVGDSSPFSLTEDRWSDNPWCQYVTSGGQQGEAPPCDYVFPESGYAIMRSSWEDAPEEATYLLFTAATYSSTHKHSDDLNFILYHHGDLFVEAGNRDYDYTNPETAYSYSNFGHNVMLVNGELFPVVYAESGAQRISSQEMATACATGITGYDMQADVVWVEGTQYRYHNADQTRQIAYSRDVPNAEGQVTVTDTVEAKEELKAEFLYHLAPGIEAEQTQEGWNLWKEGELLAQVSVFSDAPAEWRTITGEGDGEYRTAVYDGSLEAEYGTLLIVSVSCPEGSSQSGIQITLSPDEVQEDIPSYCQIDPDSEGIVTRATSRPYGVYFLRVQEAGDTVRVENTYSEEGLVYAWEVYTADLEQRLYHTKYTESSEFEYQFEQPGTYRIKAWIQTPSGEKTSTYSEDIRID